MKFTKMHGCGNDYVYVNGFEEHIAYDDKPEIVKAVSDRHTGVGGDGVIFINPADEADFEMEMWNADGTRSEMCGNGIRCVAKYVYDHKLTDKKEISIISAGAIKYLTLFTEDNKVTSVRVDMGAPILTPQEIPVDTDAVPADDITYVAGDTGICARLESTDSDKTYIGVSMGNPHAITFVDDVHTTDVHGIGREIEVHPFFPKRVNVEFIHVKDRSHIDMRVWERGTGETMACGTGACASVVACILSGQTDHTVEVTLLGGKLTINWEGPGSNVFMTGPATEVFEGEIVI